MWSWEEEEEEEQEEQEEDKEEVDNDGEGKERIGGQKNLLHMAHGETNDSQRAHGRLMIGSPMLLLIRTTTESAYIGMLHDRLQKDRSCRFYGHLK